jgi:hypothetical protein
MLGIFSCDPGGAEILSECLSNYRGKYKVCLKGPAINIFKKKIKKLKNYNLNNVLDSSNKIITSTGWSSKHEINAIIQAKKYKKYVIAILDHWVNYRERFVKNKILHLPNEMWVFNKKSLEIAKNSFSKKVIIIKKNNVYFRKIVKKIQFLKKKIKNKNNILYLTTPNADKKFSDLYFFKIFLENLYLFKKNNIKIIFRLHPLDNIQKYLEYINQSKKKYIIEISKNSIESDLARSNCVFGINSAAQAISVLANIRTINICPKSCPKKYDISLIFNKIENFFKIIKTVK